MSEKPPIEIDAPVITIEQIKTIEDFIDWATPQLETVDLYYGHGTECAEDEALWIGSYIGEFSREDFVDGWDQLITKEQIEKGKEILEQRLKTRQPLAYIINEAWFAAYRFYIDERALVPRSHLGEWIPELFQPWIALEDIEKSRRVLDLCCGSGCIGLATSLYLPETQVVLADISIEALEVAQLNIERHQLQDRVSIQQSDVFEDIKGQFDLILCNPPYVVEQSFPDFPEEYHFEPYQAFVAGDNGLDFIVPILARVGDYLSDNGYLMMEAGTAAPAMEMFYNEIPFTWLMSDSGEAVVVIISKAECIKYHDVFQKKLIEYHTAK